MIVPLALYPIVASKGGFPSFFNSLIPKIILFVTYYYTALNIFFTAIQLRTYFPIYSPKKGISINSV